MADVARNQPTHDTAKQADLLDEYVERVREHQPSLDDQLAAYREQRKRYDEMRKTASDDERQLATTRGLNRQLV